jgi:undecaprenyl-phosphate 4-deoxy-4-formamido-L-arabinose transferase
MPVSVVVPVYNSEQSLRELARRIGRVLESRNDNYELILVNDASRDRSWEVICELAAQYRWISGINLTRNFGQHNALLCGIRLAQYSTIVTLDDDLQHPPEEIQAMLEGLAQGYDVVYGTPDREEHGLWRNVASRITKIALQSAMGAQTARKVSAFRAFRTAMRDAFETYRGPFVSIDVLLSWATTRFTTVRVRHERRLIGVSNYTLRKLIRHALNMMTGFSAVPLQLASLIGFAFTLFGLGILGLVICRYLLYGSAVPGFAFLASVIAIFSGAQLFALGIMGEYLARMHFRLLDRPAYTVRGFAGAQTRATSSAAVENRARA